MTTMYDTSTEVGTREAADLLRVCTRSVQELWRAGKLKGRMQLTVGGRPYKLWITRESIEARLRQEARPPLDRARRGLPW